MVATTKPPRGMTPGTAELYDRVVALFATRDVSAADRQAIRAEMEPAIRFNSGITLTFDDLPDDAQRLIETNEAKPQVNGWASPKDVPARALPPAEPMPGSGYLAVEDAAPPASKARKPPAAQRSDFAVEYLAQRAAGKDITPGHDELHHYWTRGEGLAKWKFSPHPWTTLVAHLTKHVGLAKAKVFASRWFHEVFGYYSGSDLHRVHSGKPPRGKRIGPG